MNTLFFFPKEILVIITDIQKFKNTKLFKFQFLLIVYFYKEYTFLYYLLNIKIYNIRTYLNIRNKNQPNNNKFSDSTTKIFSSYFFSNFVSSSLWLSKSIKIFL